VVKRVVPTETWTEQETRSRLINPALVAAGWDMREQVREDYALTAGRIVIRGKLNSRERPKRADYVLFMQTSHPIAVLEAKERSQTPGSGMPQALTYAQMLDVPFAFSTNGEQYLFHDGTVSDGLAEILLQPDELPSPERLWHRYCTWKGLAPAEQALARQQYYVADPRKSLRYYQSVAVQRAVEAVAAGEKRLLLVMATGTGKTQTAFQIMWRLREAGAAKRILVLVDRNILADQAIVNDFRAFGPAMTKVSGKVDKSYEVYLALYQAVTSGQAELYQQFSRDFFDLVIIDECHRGSAAEDSAWRVVLEYFSSAVQVGLTATPKETDKISNAEYFGPAIFTYSLRDGIADGFLAPFKVRRVELDKDVGGWRPTAGQRDNAGQEIPDKIYTGKDYDRSVVLGARAIAVARSISKYMRANDRFAKTIVFCEDIDHAERMRQALVNENADLAAENPKYVVRITGDSPYGTADLDAFIDPESRFPVIVTTSKLMTTGVDAQTCKVIVLDRSVQSMTEFKQIIGRGTRVREDYGKTWFTIIDYRRATQLFADPEFDGDPEQIKVISSDDEDDADRDEGEGEGDENDGDDPKPVPEPRPKYYVDGVPVTVLQERVQYFGADGRLITESLRDYTKSQVLGAYASLDVFLQQWTVADRKTAVLTELAEHGVLLDALQEEVGDEYDPFDLICHVVYDRPLVSRSSRASKVRDSAYFERYGPQARAVLDAILDKYADAGPSGIEDAQVLRLQPLSTMGTPVELITSFGGRTEYDRAIRELEAQLYESA
jgi:type I restriction enzyme R subunit